MSGNDKYNTGAGWGARAIAMLSLAAACTLPAQPVSAQGGPDIVGLRLGMTEEQAMAALKAHGADAYVKRTMRSYTFSDGVKQHSTPQHLHVILAGAAASGAVSDRFQLMFSSPPGEQRLISVARDTSLASPPTMAQLSAQLVQKYGTPVAENPVKTPPMLSYAWAEEGKRACWRANPTLVTFASASSGGGSILQTLRRHQAKGIAPKDLSQCGYAVGAQIAGEPARSLRVFMTDFGAWAVADERAEVWVNGLREEAIKARLGAGAGPKL